MKKLSSLIENQSENTITYHEDGRIEIENQYYNLDPETTELLELKRYLVLDVHNRGARFYAEVGNECFNICDEEYELCIEVSKHNNRFRLVQRSAFNNSNPRGNDMAIFKQWCRIKGVN